MRILFLSHSFFPSVGGIETTSRALVSEFNTMGHEVRLVTWSEGSASHAFPFPVIRRPNIAALVREHRWADVVFENNPCLRLAWPALLLRKSSVVALHTWIARVDGRVGWQDRLKRLWLRRANRVIAVSESIREACWPEATVIPNGYDDDLFRISPDAVRDRDFVFLGRLVSDKGADIAVEALARFPEGKPTLTVVGDGPERARLEELSRRNALDSQVTFTGSLHGEALVACLNHHRFLLVPSRWEEPFGLVALEGMACGLVPIVSDGGGLPEAVGKAGITFKRGSMESLVVAMRGVMNLAESVDSLRGEARSHLSNHRPAIVAQKYLDVIASDFNPGKPEATR